MDEKFWLQKWLNGEIRFHQTEYNPNLVDLWDKFCHEERGSVFVPLCGKSLDMKFLSGQGHKVYACELSRLAVESFFSENSILYRKDKNLYYNEQFSIYCTDLFKLGVSDFRDVEYIYDRAAMVALPTDLREEYITWLKETFSNASIFLEVFDFENEEIGPAFSVPAKYIEEHFEKTHTIELVREVSISGEDVMLHKDQLTSYSMLTYFLTPKK